MLSLLAATAALSPAAASELPPGSIDSLVVIAMRDSLISGRLWRVVTDDPEMRAEARRIGIEKGCRAIAESRRDVEARYLEMLVPETVTAMETVVPRAVLATSEPPLSFRGGPLAAYKDKVTAELERLAPARLAAADEEMRAAFLNRTKPLDDATDPSANIVKPRENISAALGPAKPYDLNNPMQFDLACSAVLQRSSQP